MLNMMVSKPGVALAYVMAARSEPLPLSAGLVTTSASGTGLVTARHAENSDVLFDGAVAVAVMTAPLA
jgi:hypothetical protein